MSSKAVVKEVIDKASGTVAVANAFGIAPASVSGWITRDDIPADRVIPLSELTGWEFTPHMIDPIIYPNPTDGLPPQALVPKQATKQNGAAAG